MASSSNIGNLGARREDGKPVALFRIPTEEPMPLPHRFTNIKRNLVAGREAAIVDSWRRLLCRLRAEMDDIAIRGSKAIPTIRLADISDAAKVAQFGRDLRRRGAAVIKGVVSREEALSWKAEAREYIATNPTTRAFPGRDPQLFELYWSPPQIRARAHPDVLLAQRFAMSFWGSSMPGQAPISTQRPVTYADRLRIRKPGDTALSGSAHIDGGSVERWEPDGYRGLAGTYRAVFEGRWEEYDAWDSARRLNVTSDLYNGVGACSMLRMFQGWVALSDIAPGQGTLLVCPSVQMTTAYFLLRPFFRPIAPSHSFAPDRRHDFLDERNWAFDYSATAGDPPVTGSVVHGAVPGYAQEISESLHPHLQLSRTLVGVPTVEPGDYVIWHCDAVHAVDRVHRGHEDSSVFYIPACPLTQTNALYLARQRKAFLLGTPGPDFHTMHGGGAMAMGTDESSHAGRPGVQDVADAGDEDGLRAMGLLPFDEDGATSRAERDLIRMSNAILFPERFDMF